MVYIKNSDREVIHTSVNLRGIIDHARKVGILRVHIKRLESGEGIALFDFCDGSFCETEFADYRALEYFLKARRSWAGTTVFYAGGTFDI